MSSAKIRLTYSKVGLPKSILYFYIASGGGERIQNSLTGSTGHLSTPPNKQEENAMSLWDQIRNLGGNCAVLTLAQNLLRKPEGFKVNGDQATKCQQDSRFLIDNGLATVEGGKLKPTQRLIEMQ